MTNHLRYRDTDNRFKTATDAQLQAWEADQRPVARKRSWSVTIKEVAGAALACFVAGFIIAMIGGQLQGLWG